MALPSKPGTHTTHNTMNITRWLPTLALLAMACGCFFDPTALEALQCDADEQCGEGQACVDGFCATDQTPEPEPNPDPNPVPEPVPDPEPVVFCDDADMDGFQDPNDSQNCDLPIDCDDDDADRFPDNPEVCDNKDNDCNGTVDDIPEAELEDCELTQGVCAGSKKACSGGRFLPCDPSDYGPDFLEEEAFCTNGLDEKGRCLGGQVFGSIEEADERLCDGLDNDCDGLTDEPEVNVPCFLQSAGEAVNDDPQLEAAIDFCLAGVLGCLPDGNVYAQGCADAVEPIVENNQALRCDDIDQDCDGLIDEECFCLEGDEEPCYPFEDEDTIGVGTCQEGIKTCGADNQFGDCIGAIIPVEETCDNNGADNDCNNTADDIGPLGSPPEQRTVHLSECIDNDNVSICRPGTFQCDGDDIECVANIQPFSLAETCNDIGDDNDCDGLLGDLDFSDDEPSDVLIEGDECNVDGLFGACVAGEFVCNGGEFPVCVTLTPNPPNIDAQCDGVDDDCDNEEDEDHPLNDALNCGACDFACPQGTPNCCFNKEDEEPTTCVDFQTDPLNCNACGFECPEGQICEAGDCVSQD